MFDASPIVVGLEIGTSKICAAVAEVGPGGELTVIGIGQEPSRGVRKGDILDVAKAAEDVRAALAMAERMANVEINAVYLGVTGGHVVSSVLRGILPIATAHRPINTRDVEDAVALARQSNSEPGFEVIDSVRQDFDVDERPGIPNPVGFVGAVLKAHVHVIKARTSRIDIARALLGEMQLVVEKPVFCGLATAFAVLSPEQKEEGALVLDMGAGTTDYTLFSGGVLRHSGVLTVGGDHVSNDLGCAFDISLEESQTLKRDPGVAAALDGDKAAPAAVVLPGSPVRPPRSIPVDKARKIIAMRAEETLELIADDIAENAPMVRPREVILCGGCARLAGVEAIARRVFRARVSAGQVRNVSGPANILTSPEFATPVGLARYGAMRVHRARAARGGLVSRIASVFRR